MAKYASDWSDRVLQHRETRTEVEIIRENKQRNLTSGRYIRIQTREYTKTFPSSVLYYSVLLFFILYSNYLAENLCNVSSEKTFWVE